MAIPTRKVTIDLYQIVGTRLPYGKVRFTLTRSDVYDDINGGGLVTEGDWVADCDEDGHGEIFLFPNALGTQSTSYLVEVFDQSAMKVFPREGNVPVTVPDFDVKLHAILFTLPPVSKADVLWAIEKTQEYSEAAAQSAGAAAGSATASAGSAAESASYVQASADQVALAAAQVPLAAEQVVLATDQADLAGEHAAIAQSTALFVGPEPPPNPIANKEWLNTVNGRRYTWYDDGSTAQWIDAGTFVFVDDPVSVASAQTAAAAANTSAGAAAGSATAASGSAGAASGSATAASGSATAASNSAGTAAAKATAAQAAADAALIAGKVYATPAAGIAATTTTQYFSVPSTVQGEFLILYLNNAGVAQEVKRYFSSENFTNLNADPNWIFSVVDGSGLRAAIGVRPDGSFFIVYAEILTAIITALTAVTLTTSGNATLARLITSRQDIPTTDVGLLAQLLTLTDASGLRAALAILDDGTVRVHTLRANVLELLEDFAIPAATITAVSADTLNGASVDAIVSGASLEGPRFYADVEHNPGYGQSLGIGTGSQPATSLTPAYDSIMFDGGVRPLDGGAGPTGTGVRTAFVPLVEADYGGFWGETASSAAAFAIKYLLQLEDGIAYTQQNCKLLFSQDGEGGKTITELMQPVLFDRIEDSIDAGYAIANALGYTYNVTSMMWNQGQNDAVSNTPEPDYTDKMEQVRLMVQAKAQAVSGQPNPVKMLGMQTASHAAPTYNKPPTVPFAQYRAGKKYPHIRVVVPMYICTFNTVDEIHLNAASETLLGYYWGVARKRIINDKQDWRALEPIDFVKQGNVCRIRFHVPVGKLVIDDALCATIANAGFVLFNLGVSVAITSVTLTGPDSVTIVGAAPWNEVQYATVGSTPGKSGKLQGPRGNLRDEQGDAIMINGIPLHNPCLMFGEIFT